MRILLVASVLSLASLTATGEEKMLLLDRCAIVTEAGEPPFVRHRVEDLKTYLAELGKAPVPILTELTSGRGPLIVVGPRLAEQALGAPIAAEQVGDEGFLLRSATWNGTECLVVAGAKPQGTKFGLAALMKRITLAERSPAVAVPMDLVDRPRFGKRGLHLNGWPIGYPHGFRAWTEADWKSYLDLLTYEGVNLFYLWPFMEIMPVPLSPEDRSYLEECRRVVEYAQTQQGMEVWIMQCTNRVAKDDCGVRDPRRRPYWRPSQEDLDPGKQEDFDRIVQSREALYSIVNNVDGVCNIDSDPGYRPGSPLSDYVRVLKACRSLLDRNNVHGRQARLVNWMWMGWGLESDRDRDLPHQAETLRLLQQELPEPWSLVCGRFALLPVCRERGVLGKTVLLPYGVIEDEPSYPRTNVALGDVRSAMQRMRPYANELEGLMGNVQTPLMQFPHVHYYLQGAWNPDSLDRAESEVLKEVADLLYPEHSGLIVSAWQALASEDVGQLEEAEKGLRACLEGEHLGRVGLYGRKLFPDRRIVADILLAQVRYRAARGSLLGAAVPEITKEQIQARFERFLDAYLAWETANGWHELWGWKEPRWEIGDVLADRRFPPVAARFSQLLGDDQVAMTAFFDNLRRSLSPRYGQSAALDGCLDPIKRNVLAVKRISTLAQKAVASASVTPKPTEYPASAANDGFLETLYWPGALTQNNSEWLQLTWKEPQTVSRVVVHFLKHKSMVGRTIHLQKQASDDRWEDLATTVVPNQPKAPHAVATFELAAPVTLDRLRVVNLLDCFEIEVK